MIGRTLSHYKITAKLGEGGMGAVYLAEDTKLGRQVALKVLPPELAESRERLERFEREARALAALDHPGIVTIYSVDQARVGHPASTLHFLTMQRVAGETLDQLTPAAGMPLDRLFQTAVPLCEAVAAAHSKGIAHRDLKPANVMVTDEGQVKVLDFGLAKARAALEANSSALDTLAMTRQGRVLGTLPYMSPEQVQGRPIDHRTDVFSLGSMLYEMTTGRRPFDEESPAALAAAILTKTPAPISTHRSDAPPRLGQIIEKCLEKDPTCRYQDAGELARELALLREAVTHHPLIATGLTRLSTLLPRTRSARLGLAAAAVSLVAAVVVAITVGLTDRSAPPLEFPQISSLAVLPLKNLSGNPAEEYFVDGMTEALITDLSRIGALKVISRSSAMRYKETQKAVTEIARELGVDALVEGSVLREGDRVRITAQLIGAASDSNLWADRYDRDFTSILALQAEIAQVIARQIRVALTPREETLLAEVSEIDPGAYEAYLNGRFHYYKLTPADLDVAMRYFQSALEKEPDFALAYVGIANVWGGRRQMGFAAESEATEESLVALARALELDDTLAEAHGAMAAFRTWGEWDWKQGDEEYRRAIELDPNLASARAAYSHFLNITGRPDEAMQQIERAIELDPLNDFIRGFYGVDLIFARRYDEAIQQFNRALVASPDLPFVLHSLAATHWLEGDLEESLRIQRRAQLAFGAPEVERALADGYAEGGFALAVRRAAELGASLPHSPRPISVAKLFLMAGEPDSALDWLEKALEAHDAGIPYLGLPVYDSLRDHPRFQRLLERANLPRDVAASQDAG